MKNYSEKVWTLLMVFKTHGIIHFPSIYFWNSSSVISVATVNSKSENPNLFTNKNYTPNIEVVFLICQQLKMTTGDQKAYFNFRLRWDKNESTIPQYIKLKFVVSVDSIFHTSYFLKFKINMTTTGHQYLFDKNMQKCTFYERLANSFQI